MLKGAKKRAALCMRSSGHGSLSLSGALIAGCFIGVKSVKDSSPIVHGRLSAQFVKLGRRGYSKTSKELYVPESS